MRRRKLKQKITADARRNGRPAVFSTGLAAALSAATMLAALILVIIFRDRLTLDSITGLASSGTWIAVPVFLLIYIVKSLTMFFNVKLLYLAAGIVFPLPLALAVTLICTAVQVSIPYFLGRAGGRNAADTIVKRWPKLGRISALRQRSNFLFCALVRTIGLFPMDPVSMYFGACGMPFRDFLLGSITGLLPPILVTTVLGTAAEEPGSPQFIISAVLFFLLQAGAAVIFFFWIRRNNAAIMAAEKERSSNESAQ